MTLKYGKSAQDIERDQLLTRMKAAKDSGNRLEVTVCLLQAKRRLRNNYVGDDPIRDAQSRLLRAFPPIY